MIRDGFILPVDGPLTSLLQKEDMSPLSMDTGYNSPGSLSAEESHSNTPGSEREGEGEQTGQRGTKRKVNNRDAARKSRKKQTVRADELHEELQSLEQSNSALQKEIALLERDFQRYTTALERHEPSCRLRDAPSSSSSTTRLSASSDCQPGCSPPGVPHQAATSSQAAAASSLSTSLTSSLGLQTLGCVESSLSSSAPAPTSTSLASPSGSSSSSSVIAPFSASFPITPAPHSLFSDDPPLIASRPTNVTSTCTNFFTTAATSQSSQGATPDPSSMSADACFSAFHPDAFQVEQDPFLTASSDVAPPYSHLEAGNTAVGGQGCPMNAPRLHPAPPCSLLPSTFQDPAFQSLSVSPQAKPEPRPTSAFASTTSYSQHITPASLLALLTVPSPLNETQTTSSCFDGPLPHPPTSLPLLGGISDLSEFLENNDWILQ